MVSLNFAVLLLLGRLCNAIPVAPINGGQGLHGDSTFVSLPTQTIPSTTTSSPLPITPSTTSTLVPVTSSTGADETTRSSDGQHRGPFSLVPRPQSSVASLGGIEQPGHIGSGGNTGGDAGNQHTTSVATATTQALAPGIPTTAPQPASTPTPIAAKYTPAEAIPASSSAVSNPIVAGGGGRGNNPIPRPESTVAVLAPGGSDSTAQELGPAATPGNTTPLPVLPATTTEPAETDSGHWHISGGPAGQIPTGLESQSFLGDPNGVPTKKPMKPEPVKISSTPIGVISIGTSAVTADSSSHFVIGSQTLAPGSAPITHSGTVFSLPPSGTGVVIGPSTQSIAPALPQSAPVITLGSTTVTADSSSQFLVGSQTLAPGGTIVQGSETVSLASDASAVVIGSQTQQITHQQVAPTPTPVITIGGATVTANSASQFQIGSQTLVPGGPAITNTAGQTVSLAAGGSSVVVDGQTQQVSQQVQTPAPVITVGDSQITANPQSQFVIGSQTLALGSSITVSNQVIALESSGNAVVFGERTQAIHAPSQFAVTQAPIINFGQSAITANSKSEYVIAGQTLHAGSSAIVVSGSTISLAPSAAALVVNGKTAPLTPHSILATVAPPMITIGPSAIEADSSGEYIVAGQTLSAGGSAITVSGTRISLGSDTSDLVIRSSTQHLSPQILALTTEAPVLTVGSAHITAVGPSDYIYGGQTFEPGDMMTICGTIVSLAADDSFIKIGASTSLIPKSDYMFGTQMLEPGHAITVSGTVISLASDDSFLKIGSSTEILHGHTIIKSVAASSAGSTTPRPSVGDFITGSLVQAAPTGAGSPSASASGKSGSSRTYGGSIVSLWSGLMCSMAIALTAYRL